MNFAEKIRDARVRRGYTQKQLAMSCDLTTRTIQNYELGARLPKSRDTYRRLADALGLSESVLRSG